MKTSYVAGLILAVAVAFASVARAGEVNFEFSGNGITAIGTFTVGPSSTPGAEEITNITGTFSDTNLNPIVSGAITGLYQPVTYESDDLAADFTYTSGGLSYDDLFYPAGNSPAICFALINNVKTLTYPFSGGQLDIFGVAFDIAGPGGYVGDLWSNGDVGNGPIVYAAGLANATTVVDDPNSVFGPNVPPPGRYGTLSTPEPATLVLFGFGLLGVAALWTRKINLVRSPRA